MMAVIGGALLAVPSLLTMQFLMTSNRPSFGYGVAAMGSLPPGVLRRSCSATSSAPFAGPTITGGRTGTACPREPGPTGPSTTCSSARSRPCSCSGTGWRGGRLFAREFRFFLIVGCLALFYSLGRYTPGFGVIFDYFPGVKLYRRPADATFLINIALAFAAGYLVHRFAIDGIPRGAASGPRPPGLALPALAIAVNWRGRHRGAAVLLRAPGRPGAGRLPRDRPRAAPRGRCDGLGAPRIPCAGVRLPRPASSRSRAPN